MNPKKLKWIREAISCPDFGDGHYGAWGILNREQRITIKEMLDYIAILEDYIRKIHTTFDIPDRSREDPEDYWCERCCNFELPKLNLDGSGTCKITNTYSWSQQYGGNCPFFNVSCETLLINKKPKG